MIKATTKSSKNCEAVKSVSQELYKMLLEIPQMSINTPTKIKVT